jgi:hypothetical protein
VPNYIRTYFLNRCGTDLGVEFDAPESGFWGNASKPYSSLRIRTIAVMSLHALSLNALVPDRRHLIGDGGPSPTPSPRGSSPGTGLNGMEGKASLRTGCTRDCGSSPAAAATLSERLRVLEQAKALTSWPQSRRSVGCLGTNREALLREGRTGVYGPGLTVMVTSALVDSAPSSAVARST